MSFLSRWWQNSYQRLSTASCLCWSKDKETDDDDNHKSTPRGIVWLDDEATASISLSTDDSSFAEANVTHERVVTIGSSDPSASCETKRSETCSQELGMDTQQEPYLSKIEEEPPSSPDLPLQILVEMIAPFLSDRTTLTHFSMASKEIYKECKECIRFPPWPNTMLNLRNRLWAVAFSPDNQTLAVGGTDGRIRLFDRRNGPTEILTGHLGRVYSIVFTKEGTTMVTLSGDGDVRIWSVDVGRERDRSTTDEDTNGEEAMIESPFSLKRQVATHTTHAVCLAYSSETMQLATGGEGDIKLYSIPQGIGLDVLTLERNRFLVESVAFSPNGNFMAAGTGGHMIHIWDLALRQCVTSFRESSSVHALEYSPDGKYLVAGTDESDIRVWNLMTGDYVTLKGHRDLVWSVAYSPNGKHIASASDDGTVRMWNVESGSCTDIWNGHEGASVYNVAFSPDGRSIASTSDDGYLELRRTRVAVFSNKG